MTEKTAALTQVRDTGGLPRTETSGASGSTGETTFSVVTAERKQEAKAAFLSISGRKKLTPDEEIAVELGVPPSSGLFEQAKEKKPNLTWDEWINGVAKRHLASQFEAAKAVNPQLTWEQFLKDTLPTLGDEKRAIIAAGVMPIGGGAIGFDFDPVGDAPRKSEWFWTMLRFLAKERRYHGLPQYATPSTTEGRLEPFRILNPEWSDLVNARITINNVFQAMEDDKPCQEVATLVNNAEILKFFDELFALPGVGEAWMEYARRGDELIDTLGRKETIDNIHEDVRAEIARPFGAHKGAWLVGHPNPNKRLIVGHFTEGDAQLLGYELWVVMQEKLSRMALQLPRILADPNRKFGFNSLYGPDPEHNFPLTSPRVGYLERAWNNPFYHVLFPFAKWQVYSTGENLGWYFQKFIYDKRYRSGISPFITRRREDIARAYGTTQDQQFPGWINGRYAIVMATNPGVTDPNKLDELYINSCLADIGLNRTWYDPPPPDPRARERKATVDVYGKDYEGKGCILHDVSHFNPRMIKWQSLPGGFESIAAHNRDFNTAFGVMEKVDQLVAVPIPDAYLQVTGFAGYTNIPEGQDCHFKLIDGLIVMHRSIIPMLRELNLLFKISLSKAQKENRHIFAVTLDEIRKMVDTARGTQPPRISEEQYRKLYPLYVAGARNILNLSGYAAEVATGVLGFGLKALTGSK